MKRRHWLVLAVLLAASVPRASVAQGVRSTTTAAGNAEVTFHVPVQLQSLPPVVSQAAIYCRATYSGTDGGRPNASAQSVVDLANGGYSGTVDVKLALTVKGSGEPWSYNCKLSLYNTQLKTWGLPGVDAWAAPKPGTTPTIVASGTLTVQ